MSLEVGEHLSPEAAPHFVELTTYAAPIVLFSAAMPTQGGTHHVNEQWPEYSRKLFRTRGLIPTTALRKEISASLAEECLGRRRAPYRYHVTKPSR